MLARRRPAVHGIRLTPVAVVLAVALATPAAAQVVVVPTFSVGASTTPEWRILHTDAAVDPAGEVEFFWSEVLPQGGTILRRVLVSRHSSSGGLGPYVRSEDGEDLVIYAHVSARPFDGFVTAWTFDGTRPQDELQLRARYLDPAGEPRSATFRVDDPDEGGLTSVWSFATVGLPSGAAFAWYRDGPDRLVARLFDGDGRPRGGEIDVGPSTFFPKVDMAPLPNGFVVAWSGGSPSDPDVSSFARAYGATGVPLGAAFVVSTQSAFERVAASPAGDVVAVLVGRPLQSLGITELWVQRLTLAGAPLEPEILVASAPNGATLVGDLEFALNGNLYVLWADLNAPGVFARGIDTAGVPIGPSVQIDADHGYELRAARLPDGSFLNSFGRYARTSVDANVTSLCVPGTATCGDGVVDPFCEQCDAGLANSDTAPDACRTTCRPATCADGTVDAGEACDDGNRADCDGCSRTCVEEIGLGCGDGVAVPACGEVCDDGNAEDGDGCTLACALERIPGGGAHRDCYTEWSIDNLANTPRFDKYGHFRAEQVCVDGDDRCDFDGGTPGSCTFALRVCVNNTNLAGCDPGVRLQSWELRTPSARRALSDPTAAAIRAALLGTVPSNVVGPDERDHCSPVASVVVPLRGSGDRARVGKAALKSNATLYDGSADVDKLRLVCLPPAP